MGPFLTAYIRVHPDPADHGPTVRSWLEEFRRHLLEAGLGQISEIFDGDPPHHPRGCMAQAWSVGEILRAICEDFLGFRGFRPARLPELPG